MTTTTAAVGLLALGVAASPVPIIAAIMMLLSPRAKSASLGFLAGWVAGILFVIGLFTLLSSALASVDPAVMSAVQGITQLTLGAVLVVLAAVQWARRPRGDAEPRVPRWLATIDTLSAPQAAAVGFALAALNPKNLILSASAGIAIGASGLGGADNVAVIAFFTVIAASSVAIPVLAYQLARGRLTRTLDRVRAWLIRHSAVIVMVLLLVIGGSMIVSGITALR